MSIALATCAELPDGDEDAARLRAALAELGVGADWRVWDDPCVDWAAFDLVVVRSTWDYTRDRSAFLTWARSVERLANPSDVIEWNTDKVYLRDLDAAGLAVVATSWAAPGEPVELPRDGEFVVKPSVGAGSTGAGRFAARDQSARAAAEAHAARLHRQKRTVMIQPYLDEVDQVGETALVYIDGRLSHAIGKAAMLPEATVNQLDPGYSGSLYIEERITHREPTADEIALGDRVGAFVRDRFGDLLYMRVDLLPGPDGPAIIELELVEPSLFLEFADSAAESLATAIARRVPVDA